MSRRTRQSGFPSGEAIANVWRLLHRRAAARPETAFSVYLALVAAADGERQVQCSRDQISSRLEEFGVREKLNNISATLNDLTAIGILSERRQYRAPDGTLHDTVGWRRTLVVELTDLAFRVPGVGPV